MNDIKEETHSVGQQGIKSTSSQPPDVNRETTKVKLKACTVVLMDMFKPDSDSKLTVCVGTRNESGSSGSNNAGISLQKIGDVMPEEMDVEETAEHNEKEEEERNSVDRLTTSSPQSVTKEVLEYSQADVDQMQKEWKLEFQGRLLAKENEWLKKLEAKDKEKNSLNDTVNKLKQSNAQLKREVAEYERKVVEIIAEKAIKNVKEETGLTQLEDQMLAPDSVENQNSTSGDDTYHQSEDIDACPVTRVKCEEDPFDKRDSDMTTDREVCSGDAAKEMFTVSETDRTEERGGTPGRSMYTAPKEEDGGDEIESGLKPHACPLCGESYVTLSRLHCHQILHHRGVVSQTTQPSVKPFTCKICHAAFTHKTGLLSHERFHSRDSAVYGPAKPNGPNHQVMSRSRVESEKSVSGGAQSSACSSREKGRLHSGKKPYSFNGHGRYAEMPFSCSICKARFTHIHGLMSHERIHLSKSGRLRQDRVIDRNSPLIGVSSHACAVCTKSFTTKSDLRIHELSHATKNPFSCINCGESYADFSSFQHHKLSCSQKKPYPCSFCNKSFFSVQGQKNHEQLHADIKKFFCDVCGESFARKKALNRHELIHTRIIPC